MYYNIWQGHDLGKFDLYYSKDFKETIDLSDENRQPVELSMNYEDLLKQAKRQKDNYRNTTIDIKKLVVGEGNHISVHFYSSSVDKATGETRHRCVCGIWRLNQANKIDRVWAVVTPHYSS